MSASDWKPGDQVRHPERPEWGIGAVMKVESSSHQGKACQRVTVRFELGGLKTLSTAFAQLRPAGKAETDGAGQGRGWLAELERSKPADRLDALPDELTDPFSTPLDRLRRTLQMYRFTGTGASLIEWAVMQTGLKDPLSEFNRHELESHFQAFQRSLDNHLRSIAFESAKSNAEATRALLDKAPVSARDAVTRRHPLR